MHPDADAFLDAIFDHPDDDTHRLVYADWLQDRGYEDYAQFICLSIRADGGSKPPRVREQLREERLPHWKKMQERTDAFRTLSLTVHSFYRGFCFDIVTSASDFVSTATMWWPCIATPKLTIFEMTGRERNVVEAVTHHMPWVRELRCLSRPGMDVHDIDEYCFQPLDGSVFAALAAPAILTRLRSLDLTIAHADIPALRMFAASELVARLDALHVEVRFPGTDNYERITAGNQQQPNAIRLALEAFLTEHR